MALISSGIEKVRAYALSVGVGVGGNVINEPLSVLVGWQSKYDDKLYQIYVNGKLCGFTEDVDERQAVVSFRSSWQSFICIEIFAVEPRHVINDYSSEVGFTAGNRVRLIWTKKAAFAPDTVADLFSNGGCGEIDYQEPVAQGIRYWDVWQDNWGFGLSRFGASDFGYEGGGAVGFGRGNFGCGEFGFDAEQIEWISGELKCGEYKFGIIIRSKGEIPEAQACETEAITVLPAAAGGKGVSFTSYDISSNLLVLSI